MGFDFLEMSGLTEIMKDRNVWKALLAEFLGTLILVFVGCGTCTNWGEGASPSIAEIALAFGLTVATMAQAIGHISGCHINPAVTAGCLVAGKIRPIKAALYIIFQCIGGVAGSAILKSLLPEQLLSDPVYGNTLGMTIPAASVGVSQAFGIELVITFVLVMTVFGACDGNRDDVKGSVPLAIGLSITACNLAAIRFTGASMNPARTFGPAVITGIWTEHWVYWLGPVTGGALAGVLYQNAFQAMKPTHKENQGHEYEECAKIDTKEEEASV